MYVRTRVSAFESRTSLVPGGRWGVFCPFDLGAGTVRVGHSTDCRWEAGVHPLLRSALPEDWTGRRAGVRQRVVAFTCGGIMALQQGLGVLSCIFRNFSACAPVFYAILVILHTCIFRDARARAKNSRERSASVARAKRARSERSASEKLRKVVHFPLGFHENRPPKQGKLLTIFLREGAPGGAKIPRSQFVVCKLGQNNQPGKPGNRYPGVAAHPSKKCCNA